MHSQGELSETAAGTVRDLSANDNEEAQSQHARDWERRKRRPDDPRIAYRRRKYGEGGAAGGVRFRHLAVLISSFTAGFHQTARAVLLLQVAMPVIVQVGDICRTGYSGISFLKEVNLISSNALFARLPVFFFIFCDKDIGNAIMVLYPYLCSDSWKPTFCNMRSMFCWMMPGICQAIAILIAIHVSCMEEHIPNVDASAIRFVEAQQIAYSIFILTVLTRTTSDMKSFNSLDVIFVWGLLAS
jgi:hypothetical protein